MLRSTLAGNAMPVSIVDAAMRDSTNGAFITVDSAHHEVHEGHSFIASHYNASVANNGTLDVLVVTTSKVAHFVFKCTAGGDAVVTFYEGITAISNGTVLATVNLNRNSVEVPSVSAYHTPNVSVFGYTLETILLPGGAILLTFDDEFASLYTEAFSYMAGRVAPGTVYVCSGNVGGVGYCSVAQLQEMHTAGWEMANHTVTHTDLRTLSQAQVQAEFDGCATALEAWGLTGVTRHAAYPGGYYNSTTLLAMAAAGMITGRKTEVITEYILANSSYDLPFELPSVMMLDNLTTLSDLQTATNIALAQGLICVFYLHDIVAVPTIPNEVSITVFESFIDWIVAQNIPTLKISELYSLIV